MARRSAKPKAATAAKTEDTKGAQTPDQAEGQPTWQTPGSPAGGSEPPATTPPPTDLAPAAEASLSAVMSAVVPAVPLAEVPTSVKALSEPKTQPQGVLVVTGPKRGRWRAGWLFGPEPRRLPLADLTEEERAAIEGDPALTVSVEA